MHLVTLSFDEGWGPVGSSTLDRLLERLVARGVQVLPIADALA
jgi:hypothetical protein